VSVDTYLKGKDTSDYQRLRHDDVEVLIAPSMARWTQSVRMATKGPRFRRGFEIEVEHEHGPTCQH
jgi:hypothetical protein